jgi:hypothetical protein
MTEKEWVELIAEKSRFNLVNNDKALRIRTGLKLPYGNEIIEYRQDPLSNTVEFQTDMAIVEAVEDNCWKPRVVIEAKIESITTHDAITYSQKASAHRAVHPYLRYGVMLGNWGNNPLPGRLYRHGTQFDFMIAFQGFEPTEKEMVDFGNLLHLEIDASRILEKIIYDNRRAGRERFTILQRRLELK